MIRVENIAVDHGPLRAIWNASFTIGAGERVGLLGANGAGKSTIVGAVMRLYRLSNGVIYYEGSDIAGMESADLIRTGLVAVPEGRHLFTRMTVRENLLMGAYATSHRRDAQALATEICGMFPILADKAGQLAGELSGGQQQQLALGRALMSRPKVLLLDEPFIGVAPIVVEEIKDLLRKIAITGVAILLVEQNVHRALDLIDRAILLENGHVVADGKKEDLVADADFTQKFLGLD